MKSLIKCSLLLLIIMLSSVWSHAVIFGSEITSKNSSSDKRIVTKAILKNGKVIPQVTLPVVTIFAERNTNTIVSAKKKGNSSTPVFDLPEVVITAERKNGIYKIRNIASKNGLMPVVDLPEVVIIAERICNKDVALIKINGDNFPSVTLPEVIIYADFPEDRKVVVVSYNGIYIPVINLPVVEITASKTDNLFVESANSENKDDAEMNAINFGEATIKTNENFAVIVFANVKKMAKTFLVFQVNR